ncbi:MAG: hypothetical protein ACRDQD_22385, partial [Nocardioidaceae bacterium]
SQRCGVAVTSMAWPRDVETFFDEDLGMGTNRLEGRSGGEPSPRAADREPRTGPHDHHCPS